MATYDCPGQAIVSLLVQGQDPSELPERHICLDRNQNTIPVGRASKVEAKGFIAAEDNGWFDSQVMSRAHGELVADFDRQVVEICDSGSLHGTYINDEDERLPANCPREVHDGDEIRFGAIILRHGESFNPTKVRIGIMFSNSTARSARCSTFAVPEGSDVEEDYSSDGDRENATLEATNTFPRLCGAPPHPTAYLYPSHNGLDLTGSNITGFGDLGGSINDKTASHVIDLTSTGPVGPAVDARDRSDLVDTNMTGAPIDLTDGDCLSVSSDTDSLSLDEEDDDISDSDMSSLEGDARGYSDLENAFDTDLDDELDFEAEYSSEDEMVDQDDPDAMVWGDISPEATAAQEAGGNTAEDRPVEEDQVEEDQVEDGQVEDGQVKEDQVEEEAIIDAPAEVVPAEGTTATEPAADRKHTTTNDKTDAPLPVEADSHKPGYPVRGRTIDSILNPPDSLCDSALVNYGRQLATLPVNNPTGDVMGAKTSTYGAPTAREEKASTPFTPSEPCPKLVSLEANAYTSEPSPGGNIPLDAKVMGSSTYRQPVAMFPLLASGDEFLNNANSVHLGSELPSKARPPTLGGVAPGDETSAYDFQQKMKAVGGDIERERSQDRTRRTHVNIADIVDNCPQRSDGVAATDRKGKRKADEISELSKAETHWDGQRAAERLDINPRREPPVDSLAAAVSGPSGGAGPGLATGPRRKLLLRRRVAGSSPNDIHPTRLDDARPAKRMRLRRIAERIGYAALGGATVGAAIVSTLIYTAPSFA